jgi:hypothetical protein
LVGPVGIEPTTHGLKERCCLQSPKGLLLKCLEFARNLLDISIFSLFFFAIVNGDFKGDVIAVGKKRIQPGIFELNSLVEQIGKVILTQPVKVPNIIELLVGSPHWQ